MSRTVSMYVVNTGRRWPDLLRELSYVIISCLNNYLSNVSVFVLGTINFRLLVAFTNDAHIFVSILIVILIALN